MRDDHDVTVAQHFGKTATSATSQKGHQKLEYIGNLNNVGFIGKSWDIQCGKYWDNVKITILGNIVKPY